MGELKPNLSRHNILNMSNTVRAKFTCEEVAKTVNGNRVKLTPVYGGSEENDKFFSLTPYGQIEVGTINPNVEFEPGKEYYVDFTPAN